ncbi:MAG TPA: DUF4129 domain-containing protein [Methylomirabilota bacterium]|jgi:hypothetical protein|nr:DUF4129 domain-containing protein [Methylomirabilota bacterium]
MVLGVIGLAGPTRHAREGGAAASRLVARIPDPFAALVLASGTLAALLILWLLFPRGVRRKKRDDEPEFEFYHEPVKIPAWVAILLWALVLLPFVGIAYLLWSGWTPFRDAAAPLGPHRELSMPARDRFSLPGPAGVVSPAVWNVVVTTLAVCVSVGALLVLLWIMFGDRLAWWWAGPLPARRQEMLVDAVDESLYDLAREADPRVAIIKCYRRFEQVLARARVPRAPWQTPMEFMREALGRLPLPSRAVHTLTELFELARFSNEAVTTADVSFAFTTLVEIRSSLKRENADASAA